MEVKNKIYEWNGEENPERNLQEDSRGTDTSAIQSKYRCGTRYCDHRVESVNS